MKQITSMAIALFCMLGCRRPVDNSYQHLDPKVDAFLSFDTGSYWIYKDSISGSIDSMVVIEFDNYISTAAAENKYQVKFVKIGQFKVGESSSIYRWGYQTLWSSTYYNWNAYLDSLKEGISYNVFTAISLININLVDDPNNFVGNYTISGVTYDSVYKFSAKTLDGDSIFCHIRGRVGPISILYYKAGICKLNYKITNYHVNPIP